MTSSLDDTDLLGEVRRLNGLVESLTAEVSALGTHITISQDTVDAAEDSLHTSSILTKVAVAISVLCLLLSGGVVYLFHEARANAVTACRNANEARAGNLAAWEYIIEASVANHPQSAADQLLTHRFQHWIDTLYAPHDCHHLDNVYPVPAAPSLK